MYDTVAVGGQERSSAAGGFVFPGAEGAVVPNANEVRDNRFQRAAEVGANAGLFIFGPDIRDGVQSISDTVRQGARGAVQGVSDYVSSKFARLSAEENSSNDRRGGPRRPPQALTRYRERESILVCSGFKEMTDIPVVPIIPIYIAASPCRITGWRWTVHLDPYVQATPVAGVPLNVLWKIAVNKEGEIPSEPNAIGTITTPFDADSINIAGQAFVSSNYGVVIADMISVGRRQNDSDYDHAAGNEVRGSSRVSRKLQSGDFVSVTYAGCVTNATNYEFMSTLTMFIEFFVSFE